jgi:hypothetical protein
MKKLYFLSALLVSAISFGQSVVITTVVDGTLSGDGCAATTGTSSPKVIELYASGTVNFTGYKIETESNGGTPLSWSGSALDALGTVTDSFVYLVYVQTPATTTATFTEMYPGITSNIIMSAAMPNGNGNDAYRVTDGTNVIDQFGDPSQVTGSSDLTAPWAYQDSYAKRNNGVLANGGTFVASSFTYGGNDLFDSPNNTCAFLSTAINLGSYSLGIAQNDIAGLRVYPNPVTNGNLYITSDSNETKAVIIYDVLGKQVVKATTDNVVNVANLKGGVYIIKITEAGKTATRKLVIK